MRRILVCTVGGQVAPVVNAVRENRPLDRVVFLCTVGQGGGASVAKVTGPTEVRRTGRCAHCGREFEEVKVEASIVRSAELRPRDHRIEGIRDPDDLAEVLAACGRIDQDLRRRWPGEPLEVLANYTGGTKTMTLGLGYFALQHRDRGWVLQVNRPVLGGRTDLVRVRAGDLPVEQDVSELRASLALSQARRLRAARHVSSAARIVAEMATERGGGHGLRQELLAEHRLCEVLRARERLDFGHALDLLREDAALEARFGVRLRLWQKTVEILEGDQPWPNPSQNGLELVDELRDQAEHFAARGIHAQALGRLHLALRTLGRLRLRLLFDQRTREESTLATYEALQTRGDALGRFFTEHRADVESLLTHWHRSTAGGGLAPVGRAIWIAQAPRWRRWLDGAQEIL